MVTRLMTLAQREAFFHALEKNNPNPQKLMLLFGGHE